MAGLSAGELLDAELTRGLSPDVDWQASILDPLELVTPGLPRGKAITELAELLSDNAPKGSKEYKAARRAAERWSPTKGQKPMIPRASSQARLRAARRQVDQRIASLRLHGGEMQVAVLWYSGGKGRKTEHLPPRRRVHIRQRQMREVIRLWADGEHDRAGELLFAEFLGQYGIANAGDWMRDAEVLDINLETADQAEDRGFRL
jgi:hypothetical protein